MSLMARFTPAEHEHMAAAAATVSAVSRALGYAHPAAFTRGLERRPELLAAFERGRVRFEVSIVD